MKKLLIHFLFIISLTICHAATGNIAKQLYLRAGQATWFTEGEAQAPHKLYVIFDPNCYYCKKLYLALSPFIKQASLSVRWIPVAILQPSSLMKAAALLQTKQGVSKLAARIMMHDEVVDLGKPSKKIRAKIELNNKIIRDFQLGVPVMLFRADGQYQFVLGNTKEVKQLIEHMSSQF